MTASTVLVLALAKRVLRFPEHVSPGFCAGIASMCRYPGPREFVHIKLHVSSVSFSHNNVRRLSSFRKVCSPAPYDLPFPRSEY